MDILLLTHHLDAWSGSELVTLELAEELRDRGHDVYIWAARYDRAFVEKIDVPGVSFISDKSDIRELHQYSLIYSHHSMLSRIIDKRWLDAVRSNTKPALICNHLSPYERFEIPSAVSEALFSDCILANSPETASMLREFGSVFGSVRVMPNPAPAKFERARRKRTPGPLRRLLIVSNHVPDEVLGAVEELRKAGVEVEHIGLPTTARRIVPDDFIQADAVLTIGKTVQYAIRAGCPVYNYDHFGGVGWLTKTNFVEAEKVNFSGRECKEKKTSEQIIKEIEFVPQPAITASKTCPKRFKLENWADYILNIRAVKSEVESSIPLNMDLNIESIIDLEKNAHLLIDDLSDKVAEYRSAYIQSSEKLANQVSLSIQYHESYLLKSKENENFSSIISNYEDFISKEIDKNEILKEKISEYQKAYQDEAEKSAVFRSERDTYISAFIEETGKNEELRAKVDQYQKAYLDESEKTTALKFEADEYRDAYRTEASKSEKMQAEANAYRQAYIDESEKTADLKREFDRYREAYLAEANKCEILREEASGYRRAYIDESEKTADLSREFDRYREAYFEEANKCEILREEANAYHQAYIDEAGKNADLRRDLDRYRTAYFEETEKSLVSKAEISHLQEINTQYFSEINSLRNHLDSMRTEIEIKESENHVLLNSLLDVTGKYERTLCFKFRKILKILF